MENYSSPFLVWRPVVDSMGGQTWWSVVLSPKAARYGPVQPVDIALLMDMEILRGQVAVARQRIGTGCSPTIP